jgi:hypothetical protein
LRVRIAHILDICERKVKRTLWKARGTKNLMLAGVYTPECRVLILDLCANGVPDMAVGKVLLGFARAWGLSLTSVPSARTVGRIKIEAGIASKIQVVSEMLQSKGMK